MSVLERLQASAREIAAREREVITVGPFTMFIDNRRTEKWWSLALSTVGTGSEAAPALPAMAAAFADRGRKGRIEIFDELCPDLPGALEAAGWTRTDHVPVMICTPKRFVMPPAPEGIELVVPTPDAPDRMWVEWHHTQVIAFEDPEPVAPADVEGFRQRVATRFFAGATVDGQVIATAECSPIAAGVSDVGGVATLPGYRRRGIAAFVTGAAVRAAFAAGAEIAWLSAAEAAQGIYARAGFTAVGTLSVHEAP